MGGLGAAGEKKTKAKISLSWLCGGALAVPGNFLRIKNRNKSTICQNFVNILTNGRNLLNIFFTLVLFKDSKISL